MVKGVRQSGVDTAGTSMSSPLVTIKNYAPFPETCMQTLTVDLGDRSYPIHIGPGLWIGRI